MEEAHAHHNHHATEGTSNPWLRRIAIGTALVTGAVVLSPVVLPALGIGDAAMAGGAMAAMHSMGLGSGLAGAVNGVVNAIPMIGPTLANGGLLTAGVSGVIGIGGTILGHRIDNRQGDKSGIRWGKVIATAALATSALIALPSLLTSISVGIVYLAAAFAGAEVAGSAAALLSQTIGAAGSAHAAGMGMTSGIMASLPHLLSCCAPVLPVAFSFGMAGGRSNEHQHTDSAALDKQFARQPNATELARINAKYSDGSIVTLVETDGKLVPNQPCHARLKLFHKDTGKPLTDDEVAIVHTRKVHLFVLDKSLKHYQHIHPEPTKEPGVLSFTFIPRRPGHYDIWTELTMLKDNKTHRLKSTIAGSLGMSVRPHVVVNTTAECKGMSFDWKAEPPIRQGKSSVVQVNVTDAGGKPVTDLEPVMGAFAHLFGFSADGQSIVHTHPMGAEPSNPDQRGGPSLQFHVEPDHAGATQFYLQVKRDGQDVYVPFGQQIIPPSLASHKRPVRYAALSPGYAM